MGCLGKLAIVQNMGYHVLTIFRIITQTELCKLFHKNLQNPFCYLGQISLRQSPNRLNWSLCAPKKFPNYEKKGLIT